MKDARGSTGDGGVSCKAILIKKYLDTRPFWALLEEYDDPDEATIVPIPRRHCGSVAKAHQWAASTFGLGLCLGIVKRNIGAPSISVAQCGCRGNDASPSSSNSATGSLLDDQTRACQKRLIVPSALDASKGLADAPPPSGFVAEDENLVNMGE